MGEGRALPETIVYLDGFNLFYRCLKGTVYKWLDLETLFTRILSRNRVKRIKFYTANVSSHIDPGAPLRQQIYLDALATLPTVEIVKGTFMTAHKFLPLIRNAQGHPEFRPKADQCLIEPPPFMAQVLKVEEKGSDVNLASHLVFDGCKGAFEAAVVVSNDTDLVEPMRLIKEELGLPMGLVTPIKKPHQSLLQQATFVRHIRKSDLIASQFPDTVQASAGPLQRPQDWYRGRG